MNSCQSSHEYHTKLYLQPKRAPLNKYQMTVFCHKDLRMGAHVHDI